MDYISFLSQPAFFSFLLEIDRSIAEEAHGIPCVHCGGKLDRADFWRSGHGLPSGGDDECRRRFSFCCRADGCRRRSMPESLRFLRGMSYVSLVIVLFSALSNGGGQGRTATLAKRLKVSRQTVQRWLRWWHEVFMVSPFWRIRRGQFMPSLLETDLPHSLLDHYKDMIDPRSGVASLLGFLAPFSRS